MFELSVQNLWKKLKIFIVVTYLNFFYIRFLVNFCGAVHKMVISAFILNDLIPEKLMLLHMSHLSNYVECSNYSTMCIVCVLCIYSWRYKTYKNLHGHFFLHTILYPFNTMSTKSHNSNAIHSASTN